MDRYQDTVEGINAICPHLKLTYAKFVNLPPQTTFEIYKTILQEFKINYESTVKTVMDNTPYAAAYRDILPIYVVYLFSYELFTTIYRAAQRFALNAFLSIGTKRVSNHLVMMVNFFYFADNYFLQKMMPLVNKILSDYCILNTDKINDMKHAANNIAIEIATVDDTIAALNQEKDEVYFKITNNAQVEAQVTDENKAIRNAILKLTEEEKCLKRELEKELAEETRLNSLIVDDHESLLKQRDKLQAEFANLKAADEACSQTLHIKDESIKKFAETKQVIDNMIKNGLVNTIENLGICTEHIRQKINQICCENKNIADTEKEAEMLMKEIKGNKIEQELKRFDPDKETDELQKMVQALTNELESVHNATKSMRDRCEEVCSKIQHGTDCILQHQDNLKRLQKFYKDRYKQILESKGALDETVLNYLKKLKKDSKHLYKSDAA